VRALNADRPFVQDKEMQAKRHCQGDCEAKPRLAKVRQHEDQRNEYEKGDCPIYGPS
jgi:hypothetical protein